jgi:hypothetical protein
MSSVVCAETLPSAQFRPAPVRHSDVVLLSGFVSNQQQRLVRAYVACSTIDRNGSIGRFSLTTRLSEATPFRIERTRSSSRISSTTSVSTDISGLQTGDQIRLRIVASNQQRRRAGACQPNRILATGNRQNGNQLTTTSNGNLAATRFTINKVGSGLLSYGSQFRLVQGNNLAVTCPVRGNNPRCSVAPLNVGGLKDFEFRCTNGGTRFQRISLQTTPSNPQGPQGPQGPIIPTPLPPVDLPVLPLPPVAPTNPATPAAPVVGPNGLPFTPRVLPPESITPVGPRTTPVVPPTSLPPIAVPVLPVPPTSDTFTLQDALSEQALRNQLLARSTLSETAIATAHAQLADLQRRRAATVEKLASELKNLSPEAQRLGNDEIEQLESVGIVLNQGGGIIGSDTFTDADAQRKRDIVAQLFTTTTNPDVFVKAQQQFEDLQKRETAAEDQFLTSLRERQQALQRQQSSSETQKAIISKYINDVSNLIALRRAQRVTQKNQVAKQVQNAINGQLPSTTSPARQPNITPTTSAPTTTTTTSTTPSSTNIFDPRTGQRIITTVPTSTPTTPTTPINSNFLGQLAGLPIVQRSALVSGSSSVLADNDDSDSSSSLSIGACIGIAIAALALIALIAGLIYYFVAVAQKNKAASKNRAQQRVESPQIRG